MTGPANSRRDELLELAAAMFAERGLRATTVRDIADSAGILSGSLYHHFSSKEEMVDEVLRSFLDWLFARYREIIDSESNPLERLKGLFMASFEAIEHRHAQVVIYQDEAKRLLSQPRFSYIEDMNRQQRKMWLEVLNQGVDEGYFRPDSTSTSSTDSSGTPPGCRCAGISPADRSPPSKWVSSTSPSCWAGSRWTRRKTNEGV